MRSGQHAFLKSARTRHQVVMSKFCVNFVSSSLAIRTKFPEIYPNYRLINWCSKTNTGNRFSVTTFLVCLTPCHNILTIFSTGLHGVLEGVGQEVQPTSKFFFASFGGSCQGIQHLQGYSTTTSLWQRFILFYQFQVHFCSLRSNFKRQEVFNAGSIRVALTRRRFTRD
jgi:hypothetical protein